MPYFTTDELRELPDMPDSERFPDARLEAAHDWIAAIIQRECGTSFVSHEVTDTLTGNGGTGLLLSDPYVRSITSVTVDGVPVASPATTFSAHHGMLFYRGGSRWSRTTLANVVVTYTAGYSVTPPADLKEAAMRAARNWLLTSDAWTAKDSRATSLTNEFGNINLAVPGEDQPTGLPDVDATIMAYAKRVAITRGSSRARSVRLTIYGDA